MKLRRIMKAQSPKKKKKEINNNNNKEKKKKRISVKPKEHRGLRTLICPFEALRRRPWLMYGKPRWMFRFSRKKTIKKSSKIRYYLCNQWSKPIGSRVDSKGEVFWSVGEWFLVKGGSWRFPLVRIFDWNAWTNGKFSSPMCMTPPHNFLSIVIFN